MAAAVPISGTPIRPSSRPARARRLEGADREGQPRFRYACLGHAGEDGLEVKDGGDAREGVGGDGENGDGDVGGEHGNSGDFLGPLAGDADGLLDRLGLIDCAKHVVGDVGA